MQLFYQPGIGQGVFHLNPEESRHCIKVLRKHLHDPIDLVDGQGSFYKALITNTNPKKTEFEITDRRAAPTPAYYTHLAVAPTKRMERMEWLVEKATELGVDRISFLDCSRSERHEIRRERLYRKAVSAMKQSIKARLPKIDGVIPFPNFIEAAPVTAQRFIAHLDPSSLPLQPQVIKHQQYCLVIGPEGDFDPQELDLAMAKGFQPITLGSERLRTETAALAALITVHLVQ